MKFPSVTGYAAFIWGLDDDKQLNKHNPESRRSNEEFTALPFCEHSRLRNGYKSALIKAAKAQRNNKC